MKNIKKLKKFQFFASSKNDVGVNVTFYLDIFNPQVFARVRQQKSAGENQNSLRKPKF